MKKKNKGNTDYLLKTVVFITMIAILFFFLVAKFGGYVSDWITKKSCNAIDEKYVEGKTPGTGTCIKSVDDMDIKK